MVEQRTWLGLGSGSGSGLGLDVVEQRTEQRVLHGLATYYLLLTTYYLLLTTYY